MESGFKIGFGFFHGSNIVAVGFVNGNAVGHFQDTFFNALKFVARTRYHEDQEKIHHGGHAGFRLAHPYGFHQDDIKPGRFADQHGFPRFLGDAAQRAARRAGANVGALVDRELFHARLVAKDGTVRQQRNIDNKEFKPFVTYVAVAADKIRGILGYAELPSHIILTQEKGEQLLIIPGPELSVGIEVQPGISPIKIVAAIGQALAEAQQFGQMA